MLQLQTWRGCPVLFFSVFTSMFITLIGLSRHNRLYYAVFTVMKKTCFCVCVSCCFVWEVLACWSLCLTGKVKEESVDGVPTWEQKCCLINIYLPGSGLFGQTLMSLKANRWLQKVDRFWNRNTAGERRVVWVPHPHPAHTASPRHTAAATLPFLNFLPSFPRLPFFSYSPSFSLMGVT